MKWRFITLLKVKVGLLIKTRTCSKNWRLEGRHVFQQARLQPTAVFRGQNEFSYTENYDNEVEKNTIRGVLLLMDRAAKFLWHGDLPLSGEYVDSSAGRNVKKGYFITVVGMEGIIIFKRILTTNF